MLASLTAFRRRVGAFIGGFEAGLASRRLKGFQPSRAHLNTLIAAAGPDITARARWLVRNNGYAANAIESWAGNVVGAGIKPSSLIADPSLKTKVQRLWLEGQREAAAARVPDELVLKTNLLGSDAMVCERLAAYRRAGITTLRVEPADETLEARLATLGRLVGHVRARPG